MADDVRRHRAGRTPRRPVVRSTARTPSAALRSGGDPVRAARDGAGRVVGFAVGGPSRDSDAVAATGELQAIYLLADDQRRGTGSALFRRLAAELADDGHRSLSVWVLADNRSRRFYERRGGQPDREQAIRIGDRSLVEVRYLWPDVAVMC